MHIFSPLSSEILQPPSAVFQSPLPWIKGLKWGEYVGSPSAPDPVVCFSQQHGECFGSLLALPTRAICGLSCKFCLMMIYSKEQGGGHAHLHTLKDAHKSLCALISYKTVQGYTLRSLQHLAPVEVGCCAFPLLNCIKT